MTARRKGNWQRALRRCHAVHQLVAASRTLGSLASKRARCRWRGPLHAVMGDLGLSLVKLAKYEEEEGGKCGQYTELGEALSRPPARAGSCPGPTAIQGQAAWCSASAKSDAAVPQAFADRLCLCCAARAGVGARAVAASTHRVGIAAVRHSRLARAANAGAMQALEPLHDELAMSPVSLAACCLAACRAARRGVSEAAAHCPCRQVAMHP